jgi:predicted enzyme related to lactoylglutathione lyase
MYANRRNGDNSPAHIHSHRSQPSDQTLSAAAISSEGNILAQRLAMLDAIRGTPRPFEIETKPACGPIDAGSTPGAIFRSAHRARSRAVDPGTMSWHEMQSPLPEESAAYLAALLENDIVTADHGGAGSYSTILCNGLHVAGATQSEHGRDPSWNTFVRVPSVDLVCHIALARGGSVRVQPSGILGLDRRAVIADPTGAALTIISGGDDRRTVGAGAIGWDELRSIDPMESVRFWCAVFKWTASPILTARDTQGMIFLNGGRPVASVQAATRNEPASRWLPIATVRRDLLDAAVHKAIRLGARIVVPPQAHPVLGKLAIFTDPAGVEIALGSEPITNIAAA